MTEFVNGINIVDIPEATPIPVVESYAETSDEPFLEPFPVVSYIRGLVPNLEAVREHLLNEQWPSGLRELVARSFRRFPIRYFIIDDSRSMCIQDGQILLREADGSYSMAIRSRWIELTNAIKFHLKLIEKSESQAEFRFLNGPAQIVSPHHPGSARRVEQFLAKGPGGAGTPLCSNIRAVLEQIRNDKDDLRRNGQKACVVIATDGIASDGDVVEALRDLHELPCHVVVRLCTNDDNVVSHWNAMDATSELDLDVLDDFKSEALEVRSVNPWFTYGEPVHRAREFGVHITEFDSIDEKRLSLPSERVVTMNILGGPESSYPLPQRHRDEYDSFVRNKASEEPQTFDIVDGVMKPWVL